MNSKTILSIATIAILAFAVLAVTSIPNNVEAKKVKTVNCKAVKIQIKVNNVVNGTSYQATVTLMGVTKDKVQTADENETSMTIPIVFKKMAACPPIGSEFSGDVNGVAFSGVVNSLKKPNKVTVDLP